ncbi:RNA 2'-phosphotransferase [Aliikangiella marina]|uniref:Probable RNA 2'-phosphotransferase n=1 Tax=Aliikangiella marina TaxID=1712262 RepID=A0A545T4Z8_9GAMM|nr:RNA 2'-phosphotransferase [Aliikangiella marina]TQV72242.1 RNA 2'-phosphotransferase [Aliikangiella marina]
MSNINLKQYSKFLSYVLRHKPEEIDLKLDDNGWADIESLIEKARNQGKHYSFELIHKIVEDNDKQRFAISEDGRKIRANQGHSIKVELDLRAIEPPTILLHGTAQKNLSAIREEGLSKKDRHHVHLTENKQTALAVGQRYGKVVLLQIDSGSMHKEGFSFYRSDNNVWLVDSVPAEYISEID